MRPKSLVFDHFRTLNENDKVKYECNHCSASYTNKNATKFARHLVKCKKCPVEVKKHFERNENLQEEDIRPESESPLIPDNTNNNQNISPEKNVDIHRILSRAIYVTGQPLSILEHPLWKEALNALRPDYQPPSLKVISTTLLEEEHAAMKKEIIGKIQQAQSLHLAVDGWSNLRNDAIINVIIYTPKPYFYKFLETKTDRHTGEYLAEQISHILEEFGVNKFLAVISDNAANMKKCGRLLSASYDNIVWIGCVAHTLHLLISDIVKLNNIKQLFVLIVAIVKCVTNSQILSAEYKKAATEKALTVSLVLPVKTRWGSYLNCLKNFSKSKAILQSIAVNTEVAQFQEFKLKLLEENTWIQVDKHKNILQPIVDWITKLEGDYGTIHLVHQAISDVDAMFNTANAADVLGEEFTEIRAQFLERKSNALKPVHFAAAILDPSNQGCSLSPDENLDGCQFLMDHCDCDSARSVSVLEELAEYKARVNDFERHFLWNRKVQPLAWWQLFFPNTDLGRTAIKILSIPSTSASVERSFSTFSHIHTPKRNKLTTERSGKLCFIAHNWKLLNPKMNVTQSSSSSGPSMEHQINDEDDEDELESDFVDVSVTNLESDDDITIQDPLA